VTALIHKKLEIEETSMAFCSMPPISHPRGGSVRVTNQLAVGELMLERRNSRAKRT